MKRLDLTPLARAAIFTAGVALLGNTALANGNSAYIDQNGSGNSALLTQPGENNQIGSSANVVLQDGDNNDIAINQNYKGNRVGVTTYDGAPGVDQIGNHNRIDIDQDASISSVNVIQQNSSSTATALTNSLTILQTRTNTTDTDGKNWRNIVSRVEQTNTGAGTDPAEANVVEITQTRVEPRGNGHDANVIGHKTVGSNTNSDDPRLVSLGVRQNGTGNFADLDQTGHKNLIRHVNQDGANNSAKILQDGRRNGLLSGTIYGLSGAYAEQIGDENRIDVAMLGNDNQFGFQQIGNRNSAIGITMQGNGNIFGAYQEGDDNTVSPLPILGDDNHALVRQYGDLNSVSLSITGNRNGETTSFGAGVAGGIGLFSGIILQDGDSNIMTHVIMGNDNAFAFSQLGNSNVINGLQQGDGNEVAVLQGGTGNSAVFQQIGNNNNLGISQ